MHRNFRNFPTGWSTARGLPFARRSCWVIICERLIAAGLPLWRTGIFVRTLHPDIFGYRFIWKPGSDVEVGAADFTFVDSSGLPEQPAVHRVPGGGRGAGAFRRSRKQPLSDHRGPARRGRYGLYRAAVDFYRRFSPRLELDHEAAGRLHRRATGGAAQRGQAAGAAGRDPEFEPHGFDAARHLCRQPCRRADHGRPDSGAATPRR